MSSVAAHHVASKVLALADRKRLALRTVAAVNYPDPLEFSDVHATDQKLASLVEPQSAA